MSLKQEQYSVRYCF